MPYVCAAVHQLITPTAQKVRRAPFLLVKKKATSHAVVFVITDYVKIHKLLIQTSHCSYMAYLSLYCRKGFSDDKSGVRLNLVNENKQLLYISAAYFFLDLIGDSFVQWGDRRTVATYQLTIFIYQKFLKVPFYFTFEIRIILIRQVLK